MLQTIFDILIYFVIGIFFCIVGYYIFEFTRSFNLSKEIRDNHNKAAGIAVAGLFVAIAIAISAAIK